MTGPCQLRERMTPLLNVEYNQILDCQSNFFIAFVSFVFFLVWLIITFILPLSLAPQFLAFSLVFHWACAIRWQSRNEHLYFWIIQTNENEVVVVVTCVDYTQSVQTNETFNKHGLLTLSSARSRSMHNLSNREEPIEGYLSCLRAQKNTTTSFVWLMNDWIRRWKRYRRICPLLELIFVFPRISIWMTVCFERRFSVEAFA